MSGRLILLCGIAGAGKTTLAKQFEAQGAMRMCAGRGHASETFPSTSTSSTLPFPN